MDPAKELELAPQPQIDDLDEESRGDEVDFPRGTPLLDENGNETGIYYHLANQDPIRWDGLFSSNPEDKKGYSASLRHENDPLPPVESKPGNQYYALYNYMQQVRKNLNTIRMNVRYHVHNPQLLQDLKIAELRTQLDEIEARATTQDTTEPHRNVRPYDRLPTPEVLIVDTTPLLVDMVNDIISTKKIAIPSTPLLFMDSEGVDLGRKGSLTIMQVYIPASNKVYLIDVQTLGVQTFTTVGTTETTTFEDLLESRDLVKVWWDCHSDADALYAHYGVELAGVVDAQLIENATAKKARNEKSTQKFGIAVDRRTNFPYDIKSIIADVKSKGIQAMNNGLDSVLKLNMSNDEYLDHHMMQTSLEQEQESLHPMAQRPLHPIIVEYCVQDVVVLLVLYEYCLASDFWSPEWKVRVQKESNARLVLARSEDFDPDQMDMKAPPKGWQAIVRVEQQTYYSDWKRRVSPVWKAEDF